ncbi:hypothetical protein [Sinorhizobium americanum]|uniref:Uncharacterized protein n=1 Tax=Sinorhizobium americanum TaxID=194963 RepID=A0A1L3LN89_9HYPH|nr:hypothetical protein [Sinorhizobium americanum]APG84924.1 hypothetical protein SAMCCGM7_Ch2179 [Sinorhizobium americanum CCGM7]APG91570.1 hypothetical protein SAMCFNEI73_Ch2287 [Sinorhizobium americanum]OAP49055.1 hypothetical protein ATC00_16805 [Sinorhizobium americanum]TCN29129.1 hypothetical protein EV184_111231 [Sinorhizobium americanum]
MSIPVIRSNLHDHVEELFSADLLRSNDAENQRALKTFLSSTYSSLASLTWHLGADGHVFQREAAPAAEIADEAYFERNLEHQFSAGRDDQPQKSHGTHNHRQQFGGSL